MSNEFRDADGRENLNHTAKWTGSVWKSLGKVQTQDQARIEALEGEVAKVAKLLSEHIEKFACAFAEEVGLDPTKIKMVKQLIDGGVGFKLWFEPFPSDSEIELYRGRATLAETSNTAIVKRNVELEAMVEQLIEAAEPFLTFRKIVTEEPGSGWDKELYKHHLDTWNEIVAESKH